MRESLLLSPTFSISQNELVTLALGIGNPLVLGLDIRELLVGLLNRCGTDGDGTNDQSISLFVCYVFVCLFILSVCLLLI
jgi:hypothetical protein